jgi:CubicO group peptidase (beta-lactamase class C family)
MGRLCWQPIAVLLALAGAADAEQPVALPDTPAGKRAGEFLAAFNGGDVEALKKFHANSTTPDRAPQRAERDRQFGRDNGPLELLAVPKAGDQEVTLLARTGLTEMVVEIQLRFEKEAPHKLTSLMLRPGKAPAAKPAKKLTDEEVVQALDALVRKLVAADRFSGAVLLAKGEIPLYRKAFGLASVSFQVPNKIDTKFNLGSMNKMFTGVAVAQLAQRGKLSFDDLLAKHVPDYPNQEVARTVTLHQLLTHTSGMGSYFNDKYRQASKTRFRALTDYLPLFADEPLQFKPGERFGYSNAGFHVLGLVIEKVSGQDYFDYIREHVHRPAGMTNSDCYDLETDTPNLAIGYTTQGLVGPASGPRRNNLYMHVVKGGPAGGGFSTVEDLMKFAAALQSHRLLDAEHTEMVLRGKVLAFGPDERYGYGFTETVEGGKRVVGHGGGFPGISSQLDIYRDQGYTLAVMSNYDGGAQPVANKVREWLRE